MTVFHPQPLAPSGRWGSMTWYDLQNGGVIEWTHVELHVARHPHRLLAWWETAEGRVIARAHVGLA